MPHSSARERIEIADAMIVVEPAQIWLRDEGSRRHWSIDLRRYAIARHPVTQRDYRRVLGLPPSDDGADRPVVEISWYDAIAFCNVLSRHAGLGVVYAVDAAGRVDVDAAADGYRLPTEAEWEHACRAGSTDARYGELDDIAWHAGNASQRAHDVGGKQPNAWGLFDTIGNVWEWCFDIYDAQIYGEYRVFRGGGFADDERGCRASCRRKSHPTFRIDDLGFRLARNR
jgi:formylglycine-generating enzyme required for sulfatase activity